MLLYNAVRFLKIVDIGHKSILMTRSDLLTPPNEAELSEKPLYPGPDRVDPPLGKGPTSWPTALDICPDQACEEDIPKDPSTFSLET